MREVWEWIDRLPWMVDVALVWVTVSILLGLFVGRFIAVGNPSDEERR